MGIVNSVCVILSLRCLRHQVKKKVLEHQDLEFTGRIG